MYICIIRNIIVSIHLFWYIFTISSIESNKIILLETIESGLLLGVYIVLKGGGRNLKSVEKEIWHRQDTSSNYEQKKRKVNEKWEVGRKKLDNREREGPAY